MAKCFFVVSAEQKMLTQKLGGFMNKLFIYFCITTQIAVKNTREKLLMIDIQCFVVSQIRALVYVGCESK